jgi:hypothetical protein
VFSDELRIAIYLGNQAVSSRALLCEIAIVVHSVAAVTTKHFSRVVESLGEPWMFFTRSESSNGIFHQQGVILLDNYFITGPNAIRNILAEVPVNVRKALLCVRHIRPHTVKVRMFGGSALHGVV